MNSIKKNIHNTYVKEYLANNKRSDGRKLTDFRDTAINLKPITISDGSSVVKIGNTSVICGVRLELGTPKPETPNTGYLLVNVELPSLCYKKFRPGIPCDEAMETTSFLNEICNNCNLVDLKQLCICIDKLVWVISFDIYCLNYDGSIVDTCLTALLSSINTIKIPEVKYDKETEEINVITNYKALHVNSMPVASTFAIFSEKYIVADPTEEEEQLCLSKITIVTNGSRLYSLHKPGGDFIKDNQIQYCLVRAKRRALEMHKILLDAE
ncbi:exosome complex component RRP43-like [Daktulosphaira vitifoliae]|uniref:exosome complex component RRP43-like n=1 Tax=Daktulosphaira vitifoliae TaxID=58002 RepID=UPI0021AA535F|nr:exosome complex component RRP43-like [Daktulosphaira vitifoliae]